MCPELHRAAGLLTWTVFDDDIVPYASYADLLASRSKALPKVRVMVSLMRDTLTC